MTLTEWLEVAEHTREHYEPGAVELHLEHLLRWMPGKWERCSDGRIVEELSL